MANEYEAKIADVLMKVVVAIIIGAVMWIANSASNANELAKKNDQRLEAAAPHVNAIPELKADILVIKNEQRHMSEQIQKVDKKQDLILEELRKK